MSGIRRMFVLLTAAALALSGCTAAGGTASPAVTPPSLDLGTLPVERVAEPGTVAVAADVAPPTNRWYSSLAFSTDDLPVYPFPLAFAPTGTGFSVEVPAVTVDEATIGASFTGGLEITLGDGQDLTRTVVRTDPVSVTIAYADEAGALALVTLAEGSPIVTIRAMRDTTLTLPAPPEALGDGWQLAHGERTFVLSAPNTVAAGSTVTLYEGDAAQLAPIPEDAAAADWLDAMGDPVAGVEATSAEQEGASITTLQYTGTADTVVVPFPGMTTAGTCDLGMFETPYGTVSACRGAELTRSVPVVAPASRYDFDGLDDATRTRIRTQLEADVTATGPLPADTYFAGKALARLASMYELAVALGATDLAEQIIDRLDDELTPWLDPAGCKTRAERCFVYDDRLRLVVGKVVGFGSEEGNDHHFHYGYFLEAAGILAQARPERIDDLRPVMTLLAADIVTGAAGTAGAQLPALRTFDPYRGHSWASGLSPFADGNNQESSSEAVAAWNGAALWAQSAGDAELLQQATWLLSTEADAARTLWLEPETLPAGYAHTIVSMNWSSKRDYATWFSAESSAILGIQLLPLGPVSLEYLGADPDRVAKNVADAGATAFTGALGDYVQGYSALAGAEAASAAAEALADRTEFDDGWSKALAEAWVAAVQLRGW
ncbi:MAG: hypothetical protein ABS62_09875 [Microbacterium sp. SCN 70-200]|uniref:glycosyl hydrolase n=1 Tax=unclassified Microbacterium TaxID=2609290 RepID=UPI00086DFE08|nr:MULTISPECIES: glycosyl hydrolase [unclassified Microbacterium]MBN9213412.1 1,3-beta-glucanase [Microbacterium sp.]ODT40483.1 MAG: hypothetical protein ABS62_09875 [Microbacterium sp. SCN 70-200]OJV85049.1 MAG: hypothetical protein BGO46_10705 [Microbacterium sp. 70-16]